MGDNNGIPEFIDGAKRLEISGWYDDIIEAFYNKNIQFLFGSGMSHQEIGGLPLGSQLSKLFLDNFFPKNSKERPSEAIIENLLNKYPFEILAEALSIKLPNKRKGLTELLRENILKKIGSPPEAYRNFASIRNAFNYPDTVFTTNFDTYFEITLGTRAYPIDLNNYKEKFYKIKKEKSELIPIIHLHGTLDPDEYQITETDIYTRKNEVLINEFETALRTTDVFVFVGYSLNDPDFKSLYREYLELMKKRLIIEKVVFFVSPVDNIYEYNLGQKVWEARNAKWIPYTANTFFSLLNEIYDDTMISKAKDEIGRIYNKNSSDTNKLIKEIANLLLIKEEEAIQYLIQAKK